MEHKLDYKILEELVHIHSTPGAEDACAKFMTKCFTENNWNIEVLGRMAIIARSPDWDDTRKTVLFCAHMDSPGYIVQETSPSGKKGMLATLGHPSLPLENAFAEIAIDCGKKMVNGNMEQYMEGQSAWFTAESSVPRGARAAFKPSFSMEDNSIYAPFLDNRVGCFLLMQYAAAKLTGTQNNVILAATSNEEFLGCGAAALAARVKADLIIVLDATYEEKDQKIAMGQGPVLTMSDKSVTVPMKQWEKLKKLCAKWKIPLQYEIYNFSGTDAKAFPAAGHTCPVLPILIPTTGNHSPMEEADLRDMEALFTLLCKLANSESAIAELEVPFLK